MELDLTGRRAFVSGSSSGIGAGIARELASEGAVVYVHGRDRARAEALAEEINAGKGVAHFAVGDLSDDAAAARIAAEVTDRIGGIDVLVNNAGAVLRMDNPSWLDLSSSEWLDAVNLNFGATVRMSRAFVPGMVERGWGRVINISSITSTQRRGGLMDYGAAKAALDNFSVNLSKEVGPKGVTVNSVSPGVILTPALERWLAVLRERHGWPDSPEEIERIYTREHLHASVPKIGRVRNITAVVALLASTLSDYTNGAHFMIDGGIAL